MKGINDSLGGRVSCYSYVTEDEAIEAVKGFTAAIKAYNDTLKPEQKKQETDGVEITIAG